MAEHRRYDEVAELRKKDEEITGIQKVGITGLTLSGNNSATRDNMFDSHINQAVTLLKPETPDMLTGVENVVGKISASFTKVKSDSVIYKKIVKYEDIINRPTEYMLFLYSEEDDCYSVKVISDVENLTEVYGYGYNTEFIDSKEPGDSLEAGTTIVAPTSYDHMGNWRYGLNAHVYQCLIPNTEEDGCIISESFAKRGTSLNADSIEAVITEDDFPLNSYGKEDTDFYQIFPDIGQKASAGLLLAIRKKISSRVLYDFTEEALRRIHPSDMLYQVNSEAEVVDIRIFNNNPEMTENRFNSQIFEYLRSQTAYYEEVKKTCQQIIASGSNYTQDIKYQLKLAMSFTDSECRWTRDDNHVFNGVCVQIFYKQVSPLTVGRKITGRHGNKSVITQILPDREMPFIINEDETITTIDLIQNISAVSNRTTGSAMLELYANAAVRKLRNHMRAYDYTLSEKEALWFNFIKEVQPEFGERQWKRYSQLSKEDQERFFHDIEYGDRVSIQILPYEQTGDFTEDPSIYDSYLYSRLDRATRGLNFMKRDSIYMRDKYTGIPRKALTDAFIGTMYILKLKQDDKKQISVRSTGAVNSRNLPAKSHKFKQHLEPFPSTAVRFGESESLNVLCGMSSEDLALFHALYRTSPEGRESLLLHTLKDDTTVVIENGFENLVAVYNKVILKGLGVELKEYDDDWEITDIENKEQSMVYDDASGSFVLETEAETKYRERKREAEDYIGKRYVGVDTLVFDELVKQYMADDTNYVMGTDVDPDNVVELEIMDEIILPTERFIFPDTYDEIMNEK